MFGVALIGAASAADGVGLWSLPVAEVDVAQIPAPPVVERVFVRGPWRLVGSVDGVRSYEAPLPIRTRALFYDRPPEGMELREHGRPLTHNPFLEARDRAGTWEFTGDSITVRVRQGAPRPGDETYALIWADAAERESSLYLESSKLSPTEFVRRTLQVDDVTREGLLLPAPSSVGWDVTIPEGGTLQTRIGIVPPEIRTPTQSDGSDVDLLVNGAVVATWRAPARGFRTQRADLSAWAGQTVRLSFATHDAEAAGDLVFVTDPRVYVPKADPKQVVMVFVDTLRRDHLSQYGYKRETTPFLDEWSKGATVFDDARTIAPWTLPSTRALLTGREPEFWEESQTLQRRLTDRGWATGAYVGNIYLSSNFDMGVGWGEHGCINWPYAEMEVWRAKKFLDAHEDQDALLLVHFMDMHLPYKEPFSYQNLFVDKVPEGLDGAFNRNTLLRMSTFNREPIRRYLIDRYDQNLRYIDDQLQKLMVSVRDDAAVVFFADHGEEFFDHGSLEHGHSLYDELLRVPLFMRLPGIAPRHVDGRVSLMDVTPTLLSWLGIPAEGLDGKDLSTLAKTGSDPAITDRRLGFGRTLYNGEAWGVIDGAQKYTSSVGREQLYDITKDPGETQDLVPKGTPTETLVASMSTALNRPVHLGFRLYPSGRLNRDYTVEMHVPGGIKKAFVGDDPTKITSGTMEQVDPDTVRFHFTSKLEVHREAFVIPNRPAQEVSGEVTVRFVTGGGADATLLPKLYDGSSAALTRLRSDGRTLLVNYAVVPEPVGKATVASDPEMASALEALGYLDPAANAPSVKTGDPADTPEGAGGE